MTQKQIRRAARWIYVRRNAPDWWTHLVLTGHNPDSQTLGLTEQEARRVFDALSSQELMKQGGMIPIHGSGALPFYTFNFGKLKEWKELAGGIGAFFFRHGRRFAFWIWTVFLLAAGVFGQKIVEYYGEKTGGKMYENHGKPFTKGIDAPPQD